MICRLWKNVLGCPVITAEVPGAREQYGDAALYFDSMSEQDLAERIKELLQMTWFESS